jgi:hypothetical protein
MRMPLWTTTNNKVGNGDSDSGKDDGSDGGGSGKEDKGGDTQTTIN